MSAIENLLIPGSTETPDCPCGAEMRLSKVKPGGEDTEIRIFKCDTCHHEFQLRVWKAPEAQDRELMSALGQKRTSSRFTRSPRRPARAAKAAS